MPSTILVTNVRRVSLSFLFTEVRRTSLTFPATDEPAKGILLGTSVHSRLDAEGFRGVCGVDRGAGLRHDIHEGVLGGVPDDEATGGVHNEGVGVEVLTATTSMIAMMR
jgi:hypothetical protein